MSKRTGPTRIPVFGPRIPVPVPKNEQGKITKPEPTLIQRKKTNNEVTGKDIGKKVRVADKEGVLRFVGNVHFSTGIWCGVELSNAVGKNDGVVRGVRYFACPASCGLMAPLCKVSLIDEIAEDAAFGPYSMIFDTNDQLVNNTFATDVRAQEIITDSHKKDKKAPLIRSETFDRSEQFEESISTIRNSNITFVQTDNDQYNQAVNTTQIKCDTTLKIPPNNTICTRENDSEECNETTINISITNRGRVFNISHTDKEILNLSGNTKNANKSKKFDNITFDLNADSRSWNSTLVNESPRNKVPSELNLRSSSCNVDVPKSFPITDNYFSPIKTKPTQKQNKPTHSTPIIDSCRKSFGLSPINQKEEDESNKRDSLECEESLGILTPDQMVDLSCFTASPSSENIPSLLSDINIVMKYHKEAEIPSPNVVDASVKEYSLGVIDVNEMSTFLSHTTMNMELPLDTDNKEDFTLTRIEQTPSPEELPLDPTPIVDPEPKTESTQSKTTSNFITSITSITSIDTGYQGDGEMSRPASRGPDNSPLTRRPIARPQPRRPDPMTDSDFYTESDADNHEEHPLRGDRRAQVIDGTLYGVDPQAAADIYVNNRENMDSSGIFTDIESNMRNEELSSADNEPKPNQSDVSPSDSSTKTISDNSQDNVIIMPKTPISIQSPDSKNVSDSTIKEISPQRHTPTLSTATSSPTSVRSPRHTNKEEILKKYKMPKRNVASKVKAMMEPVNSSPIEKKTPPKKPVGRWDAVMNKISKGQDQNKNSIKEIKSKVFTSITTTKIESPKVSIRPANNQKVSNNKTRRVRTRATNNTTPTKKNTTINIESSIHSSLSDLSSASPIKNIGSTKKQRDVVRVTQVLTAAKLSPKTNNRSFTEGKKTPTVPAVPNDVKATIRKNLFTPKDKKKEVSSIKECGRTTTKGGRVSPGTRPPQQQRAPVKAPPRTAEALAVLVQHLVFNLEAFRVPSLRKEIEKVRLDAEEARLSCLELEEKLSDEKKRHSDIIEAERSRFRTEIATLIEQHRNAIAELNNQHAEVEQRLKQDVETRLAKIHEEKLQNLRIEYNKLNKTHKESVDILREENDAIREEIDDKNATIEKLKRYKYESEKLKKDYELKELSFKEQLENISDENVRLKDENESLLHYSSADGNSSLQIQEVQSLRVVLELKQSEVAELRKSLAKASQKADQLPIAEEKVANLSAKCEDLLSQLERKNIIEQQVVQEKSKLEESLTEEVNQNKRLKQRNEELQWKCQQNKEILTRVLEQAEEGGFNRSTMSASFNERHLSTRPTLERMPSFKEKAKNCNSDSSYSSTKSKPYDLDMIDISPPSSPKVKGVVEKSDSVSYVLEMDESPDVAASRILRRSFRNSTPPKNTPTKSPSNKRPRMKNNPLSLSASGSAIVPTIPKTEHMRSRSISLRNSDYNNTVNDDVFFWGLENSSTPRRSGGEDTYVSCNSAYKIDERSFRSCIEYKIEDNLDIDEEHDIDIKIPSLPSEIGRNDIESLPVPKHLAGEDLISGNNSDDETSSSSGAL